ncbi:Ig-like domain-containing protein [Marinicella sp. W31]|uniref:Ig-like domain-containing protein n=1 Tax=Marinicella sp. W31 TaxID=3023713 RepID=UPI00375652E5
MKSFIKAFKIGLLLLLCVSKLHAGAYIHANEVRGIDVVSHPKNYDGTGGTVINKVCIEVDSAFAASLEIPVQNTIDRYNQLVAIEGNLLLGATNDIPDGTVDIESALVHEIGHCIGMAHPNAASESGLSGDDRNYTKAIEGTNGVFDLGIGNDNVRGSADDERGDDVNLHWFLKDSNNPFVTPNGVVDQTSFSRNIADLPAGNNFVANGDRSVSTLLGLPLTEAAMQQGQVRDEDQRALTGDDVNTLLFARSGIDRITGTADDYTVNMVYGGISDAADCDITVTIDTGPSFAVCQTSGTTLSVNNWAIIFARVRFNQNVNWFFTSTRIPTPITDQLSVDNGGTVTLVDGGADSLLDNDTHPDGLPLNMSSTVFRSPVNGNVTLNTDGTFSYTHSGGSFEPDLFVYKTCVDDAGATNSCSYGKVFVSINIPNTPPVLTTIGNQSVDELQTLNFTATATDGDVPVNTLTFSLSGEPTGASITSNGMFSFTPTEAQGGGDYIFDVIVTDDGMGTLSDSETITVTVNEVNTAPILTTIGNQSVDELESLIFPVTALDEDEPENTLTYSLSGEPTGASITSDGLFSFTPTEEQGPGDYTFDVIVTDDGTGNLSDTETITVTVSEVNTAPALNAIGNQSVDELETLNFTATALDGDVPTNTLTFSLSGEPTGASITSDGMFSFTPTEAQGPGDYTFDVIVTDDGMGDLSDSETITVTVSEVNTAPTLNAIGNQSVDELETLNFTATALDGDVPTNTLTFSLSGEPSGATITTGGAFSFTPTEEQGPGEYTFEVIVTDDGMGDLSDSETITVTVNEVVNDVIFKNGFEDSGENNEY